MSNSRSKKSADGKVVRGIIRSGLPATAALAASGARLFKITISSQGTKELRSLYLL